MLQVFYAPKGHDALAFCSTSTKRFDRFVPRIQIRVKRSLSLSPLLVWRTSCRVWCEDCGGRGGGGVRHHYLQRQEISLRYVMLSSALVGMSFCTSSTPFPSAGQRKRLLNLSNPSFNAYDDFTFIFPGKPQSLCVCAGLFCSQTTFARGVSFDMSKKRGYRLFLNGLSLIQPEHLQVHLDSSLNRCHITPLLFRSLVSFHPVYHL